MSYHRITVIGHAGSEPTHHITTSGTDVANFPLYVNERYGDEEHVVRYKVAVWDKLCQTVMDHLRQGQLLMVDGRPAVEVWVSKQGEPKAQMVVTAQVLRFLGPKPRVDSEGEPLEEPA